MLKQQNMKILYRDQPLKTAMFLTAMGMKGIMINKWSMHPLQNIQLCKVFLQDFGKKYKDPKSSQNQIGGTFFASSVKNFSVILYIS